MLCHVSVPLEELTTHLTEKVQNVLIDAPGYFPFTRGMSHVWKRGVVHNLSLPVSRRAFTMFVCIEMRKHGIIIGEPDKRKKILPHDTQDSPILGIMVYSHGYVCRGCQCAHVDILHVQSHCSCGNSKDVVPTPVQTIRRNKNQQYFPVPGHRLPPPPPPPPTEDPIVDDVDNVANTTALIRQHKETLSAQFPQQEDGSADDPRSIHPCFTTLSIHKFLGSLDKEATAKLYSIIEKDSDELSPSFQRLHSLSVTALNSDSDLCDREGRSPAATIIAQQIGNFSLGYVCHRLRYMVNTDLIAEQQSLNHPTLSPDQDI